MIGEGIWRYANGLDNSRVMPDGYKREIKSIGHGVTCKEDLTNDEEVWLAFLRLSQDVSRRLKAEKLAATAVQISVRDTFLVTKQFQCETGFPTQSPTEISETALKIFKENYKWVSNVRSLSIRAINLCHEDEPIQLDLSGEHQMHQKQKLIDDTVLSLREKYGKDAAFNCCFMLEKCPDMQGKKSPLPTIMYK